MAYNAKALYFIFSSCMTIYLFMLFHPPVQLTLFHHLLPPPIWILSPFFLRSLCFVRSRICCCICFICVVCFLVAFQCCLCAYWLENWRKLPRNERRTREQYALKSSHNALSNTTIIIWYMYIQRLHNDTCVERQWWWCVCEYGASRIWTNRLHKKKQQQR